LRARESDAVLARTLMDRTEFEALRDLPAKTIEGDVRLAVNPRTDPVLTADDIPIVNAANVELTLNATYLPRRKALKINVHARGLGPICRLEVNGQEHPGATRPTSTRSRLRAVRPKTCGLK
jgi:hypothetical protein